MFIDWFTLIAQIINFMILIWLLKRFLYGPILEAIDEREKSISERFVDANAKAEAADKQQDEFRRKNEELESQRGELLNKAAEEARNSRLRMIEDARGEVEKLRAQLGDTLEKERREFEHEIVNRIRAEVTQTARAALSDLAGARLEERMAEVFIERLRGLDAETKERVTGILNSNQAPVKVCGAFELAAPQRTAIENAFAETFGAGRAINYETSPDLICGIELTAGGYRFVWSVSDYLASLEKSVGEIFSEKAKTELKADGNRA
jgi:F-type H+-transporting ATPase subunit b